MADSTLIETARKRFKLAADADEDQRKAEKAALQFYAGDQWPDDVKAERAGNQSAQGFPPLPPVPPRPCLVISKIKQPVRQVLNQERNSDMGISLVPAPDEVTEATELEVELREGLIRRIQRHSRAQGARSWGFSRAVQAGRGYYRVCTQYVSDRNDDQEVTIERIWNQANVMLDPASEESDGSDAQWGFIFTDMAYDAFVAEFGELDGYDGSTDADWRALMQEAPEWFKTENGEKSVRVADYYYVETNKSKGPTGREIVEKTVTAAKITGNKVLDKTEWPCPFIPIIKIVGEELHPHEGKSRIIGMVEPAMDAQRGSNYMISAMTEAIGLAPKAPFVGAEGQFEGHEAEWDQANVRNFSRLEYRPKDLEGNPQPAPVRQAFEPPIQAIAQTMQVFEQGIHDTTGIPSSSLGEVDPTLKSGKAILSLQKQAEHGSSDYIDNLSQSMVYEGRIINALLKPIYDRPGRIAQIMKGDGDPESVVIGVPFTKQNGRPVPAQPGTPGAKVYKLADNADWTVAIKVGKAYDTRREEASASMGEVFSAQPAMFPAYADLFFKQQDWPGAPEMAKRAKLLLPPPIQQAMQAEEGGQPQIPPQVQQQMQAMAMQLDHMTKELQAKTEYIQTEQVKAQSQALIQQMKIAADERMDARDNEVKLAIAAMTAKMEQQSIILKEVMIATREGLHQGREQEHEKAMHQTDVALDAAKTMHGTAAELSDSEASRQATADEAEKTRQHATQTQRESQSFDAALAEREALRQNSDQS